MINFLNLEATPYLEDFNRTFSVDDTLTSLLKVSKNCGVTRLSDVTKLHPISLPVCQTFRPFSKNFVVSQGKGFSYTSAKVSSLMESLEMYHSESILPNISSKIGKIEDRLTYSLKDLVPLIDSKDLLQKIEFPWVNAIDILNDKATYIPLDLVKLDFTNSELEIKLGKPSSTGLAGGNTYFEAAIKSIYEVIERHMWITNPDTHFLNVNPLVLPNSWKNFHYYLEKVNSLDFSIEIQFSSFLKHFDYIKIVLTEPEFRQRFFGTSCSFSSKDAIESAFSEAIQSFLTKITGSREDISDDEYRNFGASDVNSKRVVVEEIDLQIKEKLFETDKEEFTYVLNLLKTSNLSPIIVDLSDPKNKIPIVHTYIPGLITP